MIETVIQNILLYIEKIFGAVNRTLFRTLFGCCLLLLFADNLLAQEGIKSANWYIAKYDNSKPTGKLIFDKGFSDYEVENKNSATESDWKWMNPLPQGNDLMSLNLFANGKAITVGGNGTTIFISENGTDLSVDFGIAGFLGLISDVLFTDELNGIAIGTTGTILKTNNGGTEWEIIPSGITKNLNAVSFATTDIGVIVGERGNMLRTSDGGLTWYSLPIITQQHLYDVSFLNAQTGFAVGAYGTILRTEDGGENWIVSSSPPTSDINFYSICISDINSATIVGGGINGGEVIYHTTTGGNSWELQMSGTLYTDVFTDVSFYDNENGVVVGTSGIIYRTTNGGIDWISVTSGVTVTLTKVAMRDDGIGIIVGVTGEILRTSDYGITWVNLSDRITSNFLTSINFTDNNIGSAVGDAATILRTTDGGNTWFQQTPPTGAGQNDHFHAVSLADPMFGNAAGVFGLLSRTSDGGNMWEWQSVKSHDTTFYYDIYAMDLLNPDTGLIVGQLGLIAKLTDRNDNVWNKINHGATYQALWGVDYVNSTVAFAVGAQGTILKSTSGGSSWFIQNSNTINTLWGVHFTSSDIGTIVGSAGTILRTTNGGIQWVQQTSGTIANLYGVRFFNKDCGFAIGSGGTILWTSDGGTIWEQQLSPTIQSLRGISLIGSNAFVTGGGGSILLYPDVPVSVEELQVESIPEEFSLEQNYPNPFNPITTVKVTLPVAGDLSLKVYNILGQEISTLYDGQIEKGHYTFQWNSTDNSENSVSSGVYFYNATLRNNLLNSSAVLFSKTRKMILLK